MAVSSSVQRLAEGADGGFVRLVMGYDPALLHRGFMPGEEGGVVEHGVHVGPDGSLDRYAVGLQARHDRGKHGVGRREVSEKERSAGLRAETLARLRPQMLYAGNVLADEIATVARRIALAHVHRAGSAQAPEAGMHLRGNRPGEGASLDIPGPDCLVREAVGDIVHDRQRLPD